MPLLKLNQVSLHYGTLDLLQGVEFSLAKGDKGGLLGRNGVGKTTLLKILNGDIEPESGERWFRPGTRMAWLQQELPAATGQSIYDAVASGLAGAGELLATYHHLVTEDATTDLQALARVQQQIEDLDAWKLQQRVETTISRLGLPADAKMAELSGGWRRRVALGKALVSEPDILLLDEPTNHLDITAIEWLEGQLRSFQGALVLITHDRRFLQNVANCMAELDRGNLSFWRGDYAGFLRLREQQLNAEEKANQLFDKKLAAEEEWIRQGIKARRTRNEGRVRALEQMREERSQRRARTGSARISVDAATASGKIVAELSHVTKGFDGHCVINDFSTIVQRGDRIGIIGANGAGKTTLVRIILGELQPDKGEVKLGSRLEVAYSDQMRNQLDAEKNLIDNVCGGQEFVDVGGRRRHAISYLGEFLFAPERVRMPVKALSGGEQNRAVLARLFSKPANVLVLDEPTNDLDIETLELLEEMLLDFKGTVLLVSHDRTFMDNVVTSLIVLDGQGNATEHTGGYSDWESRGGNLIEFAVPAAKPDDTSPSVASPATKEPANSGPRKLSYKEQRELGGLPGKIEALEQQQAGLEQKLSDPALDNSDYEKVQQITAQLAQVHEQLEAAFQRWSELDSPGAG